jgi:DNA polymerase elongation subunit (family B)
MQWINDMFNQMVKDFGSNDSSLPITNIKKAIKDLEGHRVSLDKLQVKVRLSKNPDEHIVNNVHKKIGLLLDAKAGYVISYYWSYNDNKVSIDPEEISIKKYKQHLCNVLKEPLEIMACYGSG